jgi:hypothetical protein
MCNYRKRKTQENKTPQASTSTDLTPTPVIYSYNQANEYFQKNFIFNQFGYASDICDRLWYMNDLKQVKKTHRCISNRVSRHGCCSYPWKLLLKFC